MPDPYLKLAGVYDELVVDPCHSPWADVLVQLWAGDRVHDVLDLCCGSGLMTAELVDRGYEVVGLDASGAMLARARERLGAGVPLYEAVLPDLSCLPEGRQFDAVVSTLDGLNYLTLVDLRETLAAVAGHVRPDGWLVFDVHADGALRLLSAHPVMQGTFGEASYILRNEVDAAQRRCTSSLELMAPDAASSFIEEHVQYLHRREEVEGALTRAGFRVVAVTDEYSEAPLTDDSVRATWIARREV